LPGGLKIAISHSEEHFENVLGYGCCAYRDIRYSVAIEVGYGKASAGMCCRQGKVHRSLQGSVAIALKKAELTGGSQYDDIEFAVVIEVRNSGSSCTSRSADFIVNRFLERAVAHC